MYWTETVLISLSLSLLVAASFCIYQTYTENMVGHGSEMKSQSPCENEYNKKCSNGGGCCYLVDESIVGCNFS